MTPHAHPNPANLTVAVLGGGLSGAAVAYHLARITPGLRIVVVEPRAQLGAGLAYSATDPQHRLNVPDTRMTLRTDQPDGYARWRKGSARPEDVAPNGDVFTARAGFADYVAAQLAPMIRDGRLRHLRHWALSVEPDAGRYRIALSDGFVLVADALVLAISHPKAHVPPALEPIALDPRLIRDPLAPDALKAIGDKDRLAIIGNGLTASDILATLNASGYRGHVTALSRHGWRSLPHGPKQGESLADFALSPARRTLGLFRNVRAALRVDAAQGLTWHATFDRLRAQGPAIWGALPEAERLRLIRHLRSLWDIHRFRIAPQTAAAAEALTCAGQLQTLAARLVSATAGDDLTLTIRPRGAKAPRDLILDRIVLATGPHHAAVLTVTPVLCSLAGQGLIGADRTRLGIATAPTGHAIAPNASRGRIYIAGPLARGTVGELMGVPEVVAWSEHVAKAVAQDIALLSGAGT